MATRSGSVGTQPRRTAEAPRPTRRTGESPTTAQVLSARTRQSTPPLLLSDPTALRSGANGSARGLSSLPTRQASPSTKPTATNPTCSSASAIPRVSSSSAHIAKITALETLLHEQSLQIKKLEQDCKDLTTDKDELQTRAFAAQSRLDSVTEDNIRLQSLYEKMCDMYDKEIQRLQEAVHIIETRPPPALPSTRDDSPNAEPIVSAHPRRTKPQPLSAAAGNPSQPQQASATPSMNPELKQKPFLQQKLSQERKIYDLEKSVTELQRKVYDQQRALSERTRLYKSRLRQMQQHYEQQLSQMQARIPATPPSNGQGLPQSDNSPSAAQSDSTSALAPVLSSRSADQRKKPSAAWDEATRRSNSAQQSSRDQADSATASGPPRRAGSASGAQSHSLQGSETAPLPSIQGVVGPPPQRFRFNHASAARKISAKATPTSAKLATRAITDVIENIGVDELENQIKKLEQTQMLAEKEKVRIAKESSVVQTTLKGLYSSISAVATQLAVFSQSVSNAEASTEERVGAMSSFVAHLATFASSLKDVASRVESCMQEFNSWAGKADPQSLTGTWMNLGSISLASVVASNAHQAVLAIPISFANKLAPSLVEATTRTIPTHIDTHSSSSSSFRAPPPPPPPPPPSFSVGNGHPLASGPSNQICGVPMPFSASDLGAVSLKKPTLNTESDAVAGPKSGAKDTQSQLMDEMRQKAGKLKHVSIAESPKNKPVDSTPMGMLLEEIRQGVSLRKVSEQPPRKNDVRQSINFMKSFTTMLRQALSVRKASLMQSDESDYVPSDDSGDWLDPVD